MKKTSAKENATLRISFLHTVEANQPQFEEAAVSVGLSSANIRHELRTDLREAVEECGALTEDLSSQTVDCLHALAQRSDVVILTCATLGTAADGIQDAAVPILRAALPRLVSATCGRISVLCAAECALASTKHLYEQEAKEGTVQPAIIHLLHLWHLSGGHKRVSLHGCWREAVAR